MSATRPIPMSGYRLENLTSVRESERVPTKHEQPHVIFMSDAGDYSRSKLALDHTASYAAVVHAARRRFDMSANIDARAHVTGFRIEWW
jgi:hypothetical protein